MDDFTKFDGVDYTNTFAKRISVMHETVKNILSDLVSNGDHIIDIGGGPGISARIIEELGIRATITNIEPSTMIYDVPRLSFVEYIPLKMSMKEAVDAQLPYSADYLLMVSSAHEIALCNRSSSIENKKIFFSDLDIFIKKNLKRNGTLIIGFPNYKRGASQKEITRQRRLTESILGHSHPSDEFFTLDEFSWALSAQPILFVQKPMDLAPEDKEETILMANVAVFKKKI